MTIRTNLTSLLKGAAAGSSMAALLALGVPVASATTADLDSEALASGYAVDAAEAACGQKDDGDKDKAGDKESLQN